VIVEARWNILKTVPTHKRIASEIRDGVITAFGRSGSFREAGKFAIRVQSLEPFSDQQLNEVVRESTANDQISHGFDARAYVNDLIRHEVAHIDRSLIRQFAEAQEWSGSGLQSL
jgi:hypothetical protein